MATKKRKVGIESRVRKPAWEKRILFCKDTLQNNYVLDAKKQTIAVPKRRPHEWLYLEFKVIHPPDSDLQRKKLQTLLIEF